MEGQEAGAFCPSAVSVDMPPYILYATLVSRKGIGVALLALAALCTLLLVVLNVSHAPEWTFKPIILLLIGALVGGLLALLPYR